MAEGSSAAAEGVDKLSLEEEDDGYKAPEAKSVEELLAQKEGEDDALKVAEQSLQNPWGMRKRLGGRRSNR